MSIDWKAHHRLTNCLVGILWDFMDGIPTLLAVFFRNDLTPDDWGRIVQPREGGGRTTSVSVMVKGTARERAGVKKMGLGWLVLPTDGERLLDVMKVVGLSADEVQRETSQRIDL